METQNEIRHSNSKKSTRYTISPIADRGHRGITPSPFLSKFQTHLHNANLNLKKIPYFVPGINLMPKLYSHQEVYTHGKFPIRMLPIKSNLYSGTNSILTEGQTSIIGNLCKAISPFNNEKHKFNEKPLSGQYKTRCIKASESLKSKRNSEWIVSYLEVRKYKVHY